MWEEERGSKKGGESQQLCSSQVKQLTQEFSKYGDKIHQLNILSKTGSGGGGGGDDLFRSNSKISYGMQVQYVSVHTVPASWNFVVTQAAQQPPSR